MYALSGRVRLRLADLAFVMKASEATEFDLVLLEELQAHDETDTTRLCRGAV
jgi:hypothetical protein